MAQHDRVQSARRMDLQQSLQAPVESIRNYLSFVREALSTDNAQVQEDLAAIEDAVSGLDSGVAALLRGIDSVTEAELATYRHDLRNLVGVISGYAEMLLEDLEDEPEEGNRWLEFIVSECRSLLGVLSHLKEHGHAGQSTQVLEEIFSSLDESVDRAVEDTHAGRILVVDDNPSSRRLLVNQLQRQGHSTVEAASGREAMSQMRNWRPDVVLLDLIMPDMNGYQVLQALRRDDELRNTRVVMVSGMTDEEGAIRCIDAGASDYLTKPVNSTLLRARVSALLERKRWQDKEESYRAELERSRDFIRQVFGRYLSDDVVQRLLDEQGGLSLGGARQQVTLLMCDIRGFSDISQRLEPEQTVTLLNHYLGRMAEVIVRFGGTIDEFIGDAIFAIFGAPIAQEDDADRAVACALTMQMEMEVVNRQNREAGLPEVAIGVGLNTGDVVVGNIGSELRSKYGVVGHHVNLTSRVEACTVGGQVLATESTLSACASTVRSVSTQTVDMKGVADPLSLYDVVAIDGEWSLAIQTPATRRIELPQAHCVDVNYASVQDKQIGDQLRQTRVVAVGEGRLWLQGHIAKPFTDLSLYMQTGVKDLDDQRFYAKVTHLLDNETALSVTSASSELNQYWQTLADQAVATLKE